MDNLFRFIKRINAKHLESEVAQDKQGYSINIVFQYENFTLQSSNEIRSFNHTVVTYKDSNFIPQDNHNIILFNPHNIRFDYTLPQVECINSLDPREITCKKNNTFLTFKGSEAIKAKIKVESDAQLTLTDYSEDAELVIEPNGKVVFFHEAFQINSASSTQPNPNDLFMLENLSSEDLVISQSSYLKNIVENFEYYAAYEPSQIHTNPEDTSDQTKVLGENLANINDS